MKRRQFLHLTASAAALTATTSFTFAEAYPSHPVRLIVGFPPGGPTDIYARLMGEWLASRLGQPFVVENRPGAGSTIGIEAVASAPPDGYTLLLISSSEPISASYYKKLNFDLIRDIAAVGGIAFVPMVMVVHP
jgi:tripartite-type tricarboxylate transporter receptor subunit TctC